MAPVAGALAATWCSFFLAGNGIGGQYFFFFKKASGDHMTVWVYFLFFKLGVGTKMILNSTYIYNPVDPPAESVVGVTH
jgi:hypothetical protein